MENLDLDIKYIKTDKSEIPQLPLMLEGVIPRHPSSCLFSGGTGSGKTNLIVNLLTRPEFYKDYFDVIFYFCGSSDCLFETIGIPEQNIFYDNFEENINFILETQNEIIKENQIQKSPKILIVLDDLISNKKLLNTKAVKTLFIKNRHYNISTWITTQSFCEVPRVNRLQCQNIFFFKGTLSEQKRISEEFCAGGKSINEMYDIINKATCEDYSFLFINTFNKPNERYRKNFKEILF